MREKSYRNCLQKFFDWFSFHLQLVRGGGGRESIAVFDPTYLKKSGKTTSGVGKFWSGVAGGRGAQGIGRGLSLLCGCGSRYRALHGVARQTPPTESLKQKALISHYVEVIETYLTQRLKS
jgi:hypothetical protein